MHTALKAQALYDYLGISGDEILLIIFQNWDLEAFPIPNAAFASEDAMKEYLVNVPQDKRDDMLAFYRETLQHLATLAPSDQVSRYSVGRASIRGKYFIVTTDGKLRMIDDKQSGDKRLFYPLRNGFKTAHAPDVERLGYVPEPQQHGLTNPIAVDSAKSIADRIIDRHTFKEVQS